MYDNDGNVTLEFKAQAEELEDKIGTLCNEYPATLVLFVLEMALTEEITSLNSTIGDLFTAMMKEYKTKAAILLMTELVKGRLDSASIKEILENMHEEDLESKSQE
jgi:phage host-nuclease inhibitor protein Gam